MSIGARTLDGFVPPALRGEAVTRFSRARHALHRTMFELADELAATAVETAPDESLVLAYAALAGRFLGRDTTAAIDRALVLAETAAEPGRSMAQAIGALARRDHETALARTRGFLEREPADPYARHALGFLLTDVGRPADGIPVLEALLHDRPDFTPALNHLGYAYLRTGRSELAIATLRRFVDAEPDNASARDSLADALEAAGDVEGAIGQLLRAVLVAPSFAFGWVHLGEILERSREAALGASAYRRAADAAESGYGPAFRADVEARLARLGTNPE